MRTTNLQERVRLFDKEEDPAQVDFEELVELLRGHIDGMTNVSRDGSVGYEHIQPAKLIGHELNELLDVLDFAGVTDEPFGRKSLVANFLDRLLDMLLAARVNDDRGAQTSEVLADSKADASGAGRHQTYLPFHINYFIHYGIEPHQSSKQGCA